MFPANDGDRRYLTSAPFFATDWSSLELDFGILFRGSAGDWTATVTERVKQPGRVASNGCLHQRRNGGSGPLPTFTLQNSGPESSRWMSQAVRGVSEFLCVRRLVEIGFD